MRELENELDLELEFETDLTKDARKIWRIQWRYVEAAYRSCLWLLRPAEILRARGPGLLPEREHEWLRRNHFGP